MAEGEQREELLERAREHAMPRTRRIQERDRRVISICCSAAVRADAEVREHLGSALRNEELTYEELQEVVEHYAVYVGWPLGRHLDDMLLDVATELGVTG